jgi:hypothetical protein
MSIERQHDLEEEAIERDRESGWLTDEEANDRDARAAIQEPAEEAYREALGGFDR